MSGLLLCIYRDDGSLVAIVAGLDTAARLMAGTRLTLWKRDDAAGVRRASPPLGGANGDQARAVDPGRQQPDASLARHYDSWRGFREW